MLLGVAIQILKGAVKRLAGYLWTSDSPLQTWRSTHFFLAEYSCVSRRCFFLCVASHSAATFFLVSHLQLSTVTASESSAVLTFCIDFPTCRLCPKTGNFAWGEFLRINDDPSTNSRLAASPQGEIERSGDCWSHDHDRRQLEHQTCWKVSS